MDCQVRKTRDAFVAAAGGLTALADALNRAVRDGIALLTEEEKVEFFKRTSDLHWHREGELDVLADIEGRRRWRFR